MRLRGVALGLAAVIAAAHDYPVTYGVLSMGQGRASLRLRLALHHFQPELEAFAGRRLALRDGELFEPALLEAYFKDRIVLADGAGRALPWKAARQDLDAFDLVLTLEAPLKSAKGATLRHTLFFDRHAAQQNLVTVEGLGARRGLTFHARQPRLPLEGLRR
jgi:hypothetical protein